MSRHAAGRATDENLNAPPPRGRRLSPLPTLRRRHGGPRAVFRPSCEHERHPARRDPPSRLRLRPSPPHASGRRPHPLRRPRGAGPAIPARAAGVFVGWFRSASPSPPVKPFAAPSSAFAFLPPPSALLLVTSSTT